MPGIGTSAGNARADKLQMREAKRERGRAIDDRERAIWGASQQDWDPELVSEHIGPYQRSRSPVADAFLESLLTGDNPAAVQGTRNQAPQMKARAQQRFNANTGGWDALRQRQAQMQQSTPWEIKPFDRQVSTPDMSNEAWTAQRAGGLAPAETKQLLRDGFKFNEFGEFMNKSSGKIAQGAMKNNAADANSPQARQYMRGLARTRAEGVPLQDAIARGTEYLMARGAE
jgi:hypothetical protein